MIKRQSTWSWCALQAWNMFLGFFISQGQGQGSSWLTGQHGQQGCMTVFWLGCWGWVVGSC
jgi:hypothetical protein